MKLLRFLRELFVRDYACFHKLSEGQRPPWWCHVCGLTTEMGIIQHWLTPLHRRCMLMRPFWIWQPKSFITMCSRCGAQISKPTGGGEKV